MALNKFFLAVLLIVGVVQSANAQQSTRLIKHWTFIRQDLGSVWEAVRPNEKGDPASVPVWESVSLPHCINAKDAVDPSGNYYRGPAWYRIDLAIENPYKNGRSLLHFEGAGQKTDVYVYTQKVGSHTGGYDEWTVDITNAAAAFAQTAVCRRQFKGLIPISIRTDNSRDLEMIPSGLSDFNIYGGLYRYCNLIYNPALSIDKVFADPSLEKTGKEGRIRLRALLGGSMDAQDPAVSRSIFSIRLLDPEGRLLQSLPAVSPVSAAARAPGSRAAPAGLASPSASDSLILPDLVLRSPRPWSPDHPACYTVELTVKGSDGVPCTKTIRIGSRDFTFTDHGPFLLNGRRQLLQGTHRHEDHAGLGAAMTEDLMRKEMILVKDPRYKEVLIQSARTLATRFNPRIGCIRSWDHHRDLWGFPVIIDNMMNLELLFEATRLSGDSSLYKIAVTHANTTLKNHFRSDYSSYHVVDYDTLTGKVVKKMTWQGANDSSAWARGQAWGLYAYTMCYRETRDTHYLRQAEGIAGYILHHPNLPADKIPYWDFNAPGVIRAAAAGTGADTIPRDASAAAVIASALYEISAYSHNAAAYRSVADTILSNLTNKYRSAPGQNRGFILTHSTGSRPFNSEVDGPLNYADYYYLEALGRSARTGSHLPGL